MRRLLSKLLFPVDYLKKLCIVFSTRETPPCWFFITLINLIGKYTSLFNQKSRFGIVDRNSSLTSVSERRQFFQSLKDVATGRFYLTRGNRSTAICLNAYFTNQSKALRILSD